MIVVHVEKGFRGNRSEFIQVQQISCINAEEPLVNMKGSIGLSRSNSRSKRMIDENMTEEYVSHGFAEGKRQEIQNVMGNWHSG